MRENLTYGLMWQGVETASFDARRHLLTLPADAGTDFQPAPLNPDVRRLRQISFDTHF